MRCGWVTPVGRALQNPAAHAAYDELFAQYLALYPAVQPAMHRLRRSTAAGQA